MASISMACRLKGRPDIAIARPRLLNLFDAGLMCIFNRNHGTAGQIMAG
jgi:hypothetical protein